MRAKRELDDASRLAHGQIERALLTMARRGQPAKERDKVQLRGVEYSREVARQTILPIWTLHYTYFSRRYRIVVNGATAKAAGSAPASIGKVTLIAIVAFGVGLSIADPQTALRVPELAVAGLRGLFQWMFGT